MATTTSAGTYMLSAEHVEALTRLAADPDIAAMLGDRSPGEFVDRIVRLKTPFLARPPVLPDGVTYTEPGDPHWWMADYTTRSPRHILAC